MRSRRLIVNYNVTLTRRDLFADPRAVWTIACGELGCRTELHDDNEPHSIYPV